MTPIHLSNVAPHMKKVRPLQVAVPDKIAAGPRLGQLQPPVTGSDPELACFRPTSGPSRGLWRPASLQRPATSQVLAGTEVSCKAGLWRTTGGLPPLSLLLHPLSLPPYVLLHWFWPPTANVMPLHY